MNYESAMILKGLRDSIKDSKNYFKNDSSSMYKEIVNAIQGTVFILKKKGLYNDSVEKTIKKIEKEEL